MFVGIKMEDRISLKIILSIPKVIVNDEVSFSIKENVARRIIVNCNKDFKHGT